MPTRRLVSRGISVQSVLVPCAALLQLRIVGQILPVLDPLLTCTFGNRLLVIDLLLGVGWCMLLNVMAPLDNWSSTRFPYDFW